MASTHVCANMHKHCHICIHRCKRLHTAQAAQRNTCPVEQEQVELEIINVSSLSQTIREGQKTTQPSIVFILINGNQEIECEGQHHLCSQLEHLALRLVKPREDLYGVEPRQAHHPLCRLRSRGRVWQHTPVVTGL